MAIHDRAYTRAKSYSKAMRKYHIDRDTAAGRWPLYYNNIHQYTDNKIHCSCPLCSEKPTIKIVAVPEDGNLQRIGLLQIKEN